MLSKTILAHPFPNTNHRTSLALVRTYLECAGVPWPRYSLRGQGANRFHRDTHGFFRSSKYWLQLVRRPEMVRTAFEIGYSRLGIGPNTEAQIHAADLALTPDQVRDRHLAVCRQLVKDLASKEARDLLAAPNSHRLKRWVEWFKQPAKARKN
jgi:hypothetical protein